MELCYQNNPRSLFRKYAPLVTWIANTQIGRDYLGISNSLYKFRLFLPNGYQEESEDKRRTTVFSQAKYSPKLYPLLKMIDFAVRFENLDLFKDIDKVKRLLAWGMGFEGRTPDLAKNYFPLLAFSTGRPNIHFPTLTAFPDLIPKQQQLMER